MVATVFVPDGKLKIFENKINHYLDTKKDKKSGASNAKLLNTIANIRIASVKSLWTDAESRFPSIPGESFWWEVWLPVRKNRKAVIENFTRFAKGLGFRVPSGYLEFPERSVLLLYGSLDQMSASMTALNMIAELRKAKETADFYVSSSLTEQNDQTEALLARTEFGAQNPPYICVLDSGANHSHPLLKNSLLSEDMHAVNKAWGTHDQQDHGTGIAGLSLWGNLTDAFNSSLPIYINHRLESVKLLPDVGENDPQLYGLITIQGVAYPESTAPDRSRVFNMAVTADGTDRGRPSAWSSTIDSLSTDVVNHGETPRLFVISAGNSNFENYKDYPDSNTTESIQDPAQSWNALTVGAYTDLITITEPDVEDKPLAPQGGLSPFSTTSQIWQKKWPLKPDVVFEGGNLGTDGRFCCRFDSLELLTAHSNFEERLLTTSNATSAASALCSNMAARLMAEYPNLCPETIQQTC